MSKQYKVLTIHHHGRLPITIDKLKTLLINKFHDIIDVKVVGEPDSDNVTRIEIFSDRCSSSEVLKLLKDCESKQGGFVKGNNMAVVGKKQEEHREQSKDKSVEMSFLHVAKVIEDIRTQIGGYEGGVAQLVKDLNSVKIAIFGNEDPKDVKKENDDLKKANSGLNQQVLDLKKRLKNVENHLSNFKKIDEETKA